jgi:hypothetical protein
MLLTNHEVFASQLSSVIRSARHEAVDTVHVTFGRCLPLYRIGWSYPA